MEIWTQKVVDLKDEHVKLQAEREIGGFDGEDEDFSITIDENVSREDFYAWYGSIQAKSIQPMFVPKTIHDISIGDIVIYEFPCKTRRVAMDIFSRELQDEIRDGTHELSFGEYFPNTIRVEWVDGTIKAPDVGIGMGQDDPALIVVEVAYFQSLRQLRQHLQDWIDYTADVLMAIGIKIYPKDKSGQRRMELLYLDCDGKTQQIEFGKTKSPKPLEIEVGIFWKNVPQGCEDAIHDFDLTFTRDQMLEQMD